MKNKHIIDISKDNNYTSDLNIKIHKYTKFWLHIATIKPSTIKPSTIKPITEIPNVDLFNIAYVHLFDIAYVHLFLNESISLKQSIFDKLFYNISISYYCFGKLNPFSGCNFYGLVEDNLIWTEFGKEKFQKHSLYVFNEIRKTMFNKFKRPKSYSELHPCYQILFDHVSNQQIKFDLERKLSGYE